MFVMFMMLHNTFLPSSASLLDFSKRSSEFLLVIQVSARACIPISV
jgi:hypothetical protein